MMKNYYGYDLDGLRLTIVREGQLIFNASSSNPRKNEDSIVFISPYEFEERGNLYLYDQKDIKKLPLDIPIDESPKAVCWVNDEYLLLIVGEYHGTINIGGDLYLYSLKNKRVKKIKKFSHEIQITEIYSKSTTEYELSGIKYIDDEFNEHVGYIEKFKFEIEKE